MITVNEAIFEGRINRREYLARTLFGSVLLSSGQLRELQHRLAGRRLAFRGLEVDNDWTQDTEFVCKSVGLVLLVGWKDRVRRRRDLMSEQTVEATVAAEPCSRWNGSLAIRLVDGKLGSATGD